MKKVFSDMTVGALLIPVVLLLSSMTVYKANFSGDWKLDEGKSELGDFGARVARSIKVDQNDNAITITRTTPGFNGGDPVTSAVTLTYDGKVVETEGFGGSKRKSTAKWTDDNTLAIDNTITFERDGQTSEFKSTETWSMTKDGALSVVTHSNSPRGESTTKAIYKK